MKTGFWAGVVLASGVIMGCDGQNERAPEPVERGIKNQEMTNQGQDQERDSISPAMETDPTIDQEAEPPEDGNEAAEQDSYMPGAEDPEEMRQPDPQDLQ